MVLLSIHLPAKFRLEVKLTKKRKNLDAKPLLPNLGKVLRAKNGNKLSRYFRPLFENEKIKKLIGTNLALLVVASSLLPATTSGSEELETNFISSPIVLITEEGLQFPVQNVKITQNYRFFHPGIDFDGVTGDAIYPIMAGTVSKIEYSRFGYGRSVTIYHGGETESLYAHLSKIEVAEGQEVTKDTKLGEMGATGRSFGDHLHLEIHENGKAINPLSILP
jgi:murein DD-endopeptidase MepM/ murein hydrolase activator NlpD